MVTLQTTGQSLTPTSSRRVRIYDRQIVLLHPFGIKITPRDTPGFSPDVVEKIRRAFITIH